MIMAYFQRKDFVQRNLDLNCDKRDIVWFVSTACYLRRHWPECFGRVKRTIVFTGAIDVLHGAVVRRPISA